MLMFKASKSVVDTDEFRFGNLQYWLATGEVDTSKLSELTRASWKHVAEDPNAPSQNSGPSSFSRIRQPCGRRTDQFCWLHSALYLYAAVTVREW